MNTKTIRRKKSSSSEVKVAVIGAPGVGKSGEFYDIKNGISYTRKVFFGRAIIKSYF